MQLSDEFMTSLRMANPIDRVMQSYVNIIRKGHNFVCSCPFHSEKTPSCTIYPDTQSFYCFGCGVGGDVVTFIKKIENLEYMEAVRFLATMQTLEATISSVRKPFAIRCLVRESQLSGANPSPYFLTVCGDIRLCIRYLRACFEESPEQRF